MERVGADGVWSVENFLLACEELESQGNIHEALRWSYELKSATYHVL